MGTDITEICGERTAIALTEIFGERARDIVEGLDMLRLMQVPGLGRKKALSMIRKSYSERYGDGFEKVLSANSEKMYERIVDILRSYVVTDEAKEMVYSYFPVRERETIEERMERDNEAFGERIDRLERQVEAIREQMEAVDVWITHVDRHLDTQDAAMARLADETHTWTEYVRDELAWLRLSWWKRRQQK